jgi:hypothetical protein
VSPAHVVVEPRHVSWFTAEAERLLIDLGVARVAADPACCPAASRPGAAVRPSYFRWHGSPRTYFSAYPPAAIAAFAAQVLALKRAHGARSEVYCFFDNTALGAAAINALSLQTELSAPFDPELHAPNRPRLIGMRRAPVPQRHPLPEQGVDDEQQIGRQEDPVLEQEAIRREADRRRELPDEQPGGDAAAVARLPLLSHLLPQGQHEDE